MTTESELFDAVRDAWASVPAPPADDMKYMEWGWGEEAARAFTGVAPVDVDITSAGFYAATPLFDLPSRAGAAYLGTFLLSLLRSLENQKPMGIYFDFETRAHVLTCLSNPTFWKGVRPLLSPKQRDVVRRVVQHLASERELLALSREKADAMIELASAE